MSDAKKENEKASVTNIKKTADSVSLEEAEALIFENLQLQKQLNKAALEEIVRREANLIKRIEQRTNIDISGWNVNYNTGVCTPIINQVEDNDLR